METLKLIAKSRTFWTLAFSFAYNVYNAFAGTFTPEQSLLINALLTTLATYFKISPSQTYKKSK